jgi:hypothetical protein
VAWSELLQTPCLYKKQVAFSSALCNLALGQLCILHYSLLSLGCNDAVLHSAKKKRGILFSVNWCYDYFIPLVTKNKLLNKSISKKENSKKHMGFDEPHLSSERSPTRLSTLGHARHKGQSCIWVNKERTVQPQITC